VPIPSTLLTSTSRRLRTQAVFSTPTSSVDFVIHGRPINRGNGCDPPARAYFMYVASIHRYKGARARLSTTWFWKNANLLPDQRRAFVRQIAKTMRRATSVSASRLSSGAIARIRWTRASSSVTCFKAATAPTRVMPIAAIAPASSAGCWL